ncbi:MAG: MBL fold metallo-hydrolase [Ferruginibacter sp.]
MSLFITSLNSGSNGNCYYIGNDTEAVLIDAGISCKETEKRMQLLGLSMNRVKAIFISHEHTDHIKGLPAIAEKYDLPVYITGRTMRNCAMPVRKQLEKNFQPYQPVSIGNITVTAFPKFHDAVDPHSFIIAFNNICIGVFTDIGAPCKHVLKHFSLCHAAFLETNYDESLLDNGNYPIFLKNRIRGGHGHLSNNQALEIFTKHRPSFMTHLLLSHLSKDNNDPQLVQHLFDAQATGVKIIVASRHEQTAVYQVHHGDATPAEINRARRFSYFSKERKKETGQLSLFS